MTTQVCWICRARDADIREHKFKALDLRRFFGKGNWASEVPEPGPVIYFAAEDAEHMVPSCDDESRISLLLAQIDPDGHLCRLDLRYHDLRPDKVGR